MSPGSVREYLRRRAFRPFRTCLFDGTCHTAPHPDMAIVTTRDAIVGIDPNDRGLASRTAFC